MPLLTAHRGSSRVAPENTLSALERAILDGADFCEVDVQQISDGTLVLVHDDDLARVAGENRPVRGLTRRDLADFDVGSWFDARFRDERIPLLEQALDLCRGRVRLNLELKIHGFEVRLVERLAALLRPADDCIVSSLDPAPLRRLRDAARIPVGRVLTTDDASGDAEWDFVSLALTTATETRIRAHREAHVWTVNEESDARRLVAHGAANLITDDPALLRPWLDD